MYKSVNGFHAALYSDKSIVCKVRREVDSLIYRAGKGNI